MELNALQRFESARLQAAQRGATPARNLQTTQTEGALGQFLLKFAGVKDAVKNDMPLSNSAASSVSRTTSTQRLDQAVMAKQAAAGNMQSLQALIESKRAEQGLPAKSFQTYGRSGHLAAIQQQPEQPKGRVVGGRLDLVG
jgi:hypothetical protein